MTDPNTNSDNATASPSDTEPVTGAIADMPATDDAAALGGTAQQQLDAARDKHLRLAAEYDNFRRRATKERQEAGWRAQGEMVRGLIDALDDISRFAHVDPTTVDSKTVVDGVLMVERKVFKSLAGHGLELIDPLGHPFDPARHEAVSTAPANSAEEDDTIAAVFQVGYVINGLLLRPARVVVKQWSGTPVS
ncbi:MAG: nucleotide exchange factor GrpE [Phycisphaerae bacterium]|nr:nucleotide exchange factor GrpE [Gemmatimonadaceae bacterium]